MGSSDTIVVLSELNMIQYSHKPGKYDCVPLQHRVLVGLELRIQNPNWTATALQSSLPQRNAQAAKIQNLKLRPKQNTIL